VKRDPVQKQGGCCTVLQVCKFRTEKISGGIHDLSPPGRVTFSRYCTFIATSTFNLHPISTRRTWALCLRFLYDAEQTTYFRTMRHELYARTQRNSPIFDFYFHIHNPQSIKSDNPDTLPKDNSMITLHVTSHLLYLFNFYIPCHYHLFHRGRWHCNRYVCISCEFA
jgi:hypothetical protein